MKKVLNFGSLNIDKVYELDEIVRPGETIAAISYDDFIGGKGLNQSIALKRAGADVYHAGYVGEDGDILIDYLLANEITSMVQQIVGPSGHTIIQVDKNGNNSIIVGAGANKKIDTDYIEKVFRDFESGDYLVIQNEINNLARIIKSAKAKGMHIIFNPSPIDKNVSTIDFNDISYLIINETEGQMLTGCKKPSEILEKFSNDYPNLRLILTLGARGGIYKSAGEVIEFPSFDVDVIDTTAAGDTFLGYFVAGLARGIDIDEILTTASLAAALTCTKKGAADSIPSLDEVIKWRING